MLTKDYAATNSNIGLNAISRYLPKPQENIGQILAHGVMNWNEAKAQEQQQKFNQAYADLLKEQHPEEAARIDAMGALNAGTYYDALAKEARDQQYKLDYLSKQHENAIGLENLRNSNAYGLSDHKFALEQKLAQINDQRTVSAMREKEAYIDALNLADDVKQNLKMKLHGIDYNPMSLKDFAGISKQLVESGVDTDALNYVAENNGFAGLKFAPPEKKYANGDLGAIQYMTDNGIPLEEALSRVNKMTPAEKLQYELAKTQGEEGIKYGYNSALEDQRQSGRVDLANLNSTNNLNNNMALEQIKQQYTRENKAIDLQNDIDRIVLKSELNKDFEQFKNELPTETIRTAQQISALSGEPVDNILMQDYRSKQIEARQKLADIDYKQAQTEKVQRENSQPYLSPIEEYKQKAEINAAIKQRQIDAKEAKEKAEKDENTARSMAIAQNGLNELKNVADSKNLSAYQGVTQYMPWSGKSVQRAKGKISAAVAAIAPIAIQRLKDAGVSGINSLPEFMTYVGLPLNPTSEEIAAAVPIIADILGIENPYDSQMAEGTVIENDKGERMILRGGEWQKM